MDMHTDTTAHLAAEAEAPARAAADMAAAMAGPTDNPVSLAALLAKRNAMMDAINLRAPGDDAPDQEVTQANEAAFAVEQEILTTPCRTADDAVAKVAALVEFVREAGCPDENDVENVLADIGRALRGSSYPIRATKVDRRDAHWTLAPHQTIASAALQLPTNLAAIAAAARDYGDRFVVPARAEYDRREDAERHNKDAAKKAEFKAAEDRAWQVLDAHYDVHRSIFSQMLELPAASPEELVAHVETYAAALDPLHVAYPKGETLLGRLDDMEVRELAVHMYENLKRMGAGPDAVEASPVVPAGPNTPLAEAVALRDRRRAERSAYVDEHDEDCPREMDDAVGRAEHGVFLAPATNAAEALWKHAENMMEDEECSTHAEAVAIKEGTYGLEAAVAVGTYRDLERLAAAERPSLVIAALLAKLEELYEVERREGEEGREEDQEDTVRVIRQLANGILDTPGKTLADFQAKARAVEWAVSGDWSTWTERGGSTGQYFAACLIRELLGQDHPDVLVGRDAIREAWIEARAKANPELLAAE